MCMYVYVYMPYTFLTTMYLLITLVNTIYRLTVELHLSGTAIIRVGLALRG